MAQVHQAPRGQWTKRVRRAMNKQLGMKTNSRRFQHKRVQAQPNRCQGNESSDGDNKKRGPGASRRNILFSSGITSMAGGSMAST